MTNGYRTNDSTTEDRTYSWVAAFGLVLILFIVIGGTSLIPDVERDYARACESAGLTYWNTGSAGPRCQDENGNRYEIPTR